MARKPNLENVIIAGAYTKLEDLIKHYSTSDIFVLPILGDVWGFVVNEAILCELPVVSTVASQVVLEMIEQGKSGYIVRSGYATMLYLTLKYLRINEEKRIIYSNEEIQCQNDGNGAFNGYSTLP